MGNGRMARWMEFGFDVHGADSATSPWLGRSWWLNSVATNPQRPSVASLSFSLRFIPAASTATDCLPQQIHDRPHRALCLGRRDNSVSVCYPPVGRPAAMLKAGCPYLGNHGSWLPCLTGHQAGREGGNGMGGAHLWALNGIVLFFAFRLSPFSTLEIH